MRRDESIPDQPVHGPYGAAANWVGQLPDRVPLAVAELRWSPVLSEQSWEPGREELDELWPWGGAVSWIGGPAVPHPDGWPVNREGKPMAHVLTLDLETTVGSADDEEKQAWPYEVDPLPAEGLLEVFHDLDNYGYEEGDDHGWAVRWIPDPDRDQPLVEPPDSTPNPTDVCQPALAMPGWSLPWADRLYQPGGDLVAELAEQHDTAWWVHRFPGQPPQAFAPTRLHGHSIAGTDTAEELLEQHLPLEDDEDHYHLLLDIESWTALAGWFHDAGRLEVWMRWSDAVAHRFDRAWCIVRTDA